MCLMLCLMLGFTGVSVMLLFWGLTILKSSL